MMACSTTYESYAVRLEELKKQIEKNRNTRETSTHNGKVHSVAWNCDGRRIASGSVDKSVSVLSLEHDKLRSESNFKGHTDSVDQVCWHPSHPDQLVSASVDRTVRIWDVRSNKCSHVINTKGDNLNLCWSPDGSTIGVGNKDDLITFIDTNSYKIKVEEQFKVEVNEISWNNTSDMFFLTTGHGWINVLSYPELKQLHTINAHPANCICIKFDPTGKYFATGSADALVSLWDLSELACVRTFSRLDWPVRSISFSYDGQLLASASEDSFIDIGFVETGAKVYSVQCTDPTFIVAWHPNKYLLAYACDEKDKHNRDTGNIWLFGVNP